MKNFDLEAAKQGAAVCTAYGMPVRILCFDRKGGNFPIIALIDDTDSSESFATFTEEGEENPCSKMGIILMMRDDDYLKKLERGEYGNHIPDAREKVGVNEFEKHPRLADYIRSMATTGQLPSDWSGFIAALNGGLASTTDREYWRRVYAGQAMQGEISGYLAAGEGFNGDKSIPGIIAKSSVMIADALIEELEKTETK
jgi:hypothetical protein